MINKLLKVGLIVPLFVLALAATLVTCRSGGDAESPVAGHSPALPPAPQAAAPTPLPVSLDSAVPNSVTVYIKLTVDRKYGFLAHVAGMRNNAYIRTNYDVKNAWWDNPLVVFVDPPFEKPDVIGSAEAEQLTGKGASSNVDVAVTLVPHADVAIKTTPRSDAIKGTITVSITTEADFYDGGWNQMLNVKDRELTFNIDTTDPKRQMVEVGQETRLIPNVSFERYTREQEKWEPKTAWPAKAASGDWRTVIYGKGAVLKFTSYRYVDSLAAEAQVPTQGK